jgi:hypothetical protein
MVTSELDGWSSLRVEYRTRLTGLLAQNFFPGLYAAKDRDETQALTKGLFEERQGTGQHPSGHKQVC